MNYRKQAVYCLFILAIWGITAFNPISVWATGSPATGIEEAKAAIENARQAGAEKLAQDDMTQARSWLAQAESEYARSRSLLSRSMKLIISDEAKIQEIQYLATMARITGQIAEAKARKAGVAAELKNAQKDLADYQAALDVLNKKSAEAEVASKVKAQAEAEQKKLEQASHFGKQKDEGSGGSEKESCGSRSRQTERAERSQFERSAVGLPEGERGSRTPDTPAKNGDVG